MKKISWFIGEVNKMYSESEKSFFSKKRVEGGIAFIVLQWGLIHWMVKTLLLPERMPASELFIWSSIELAICGYTLSKIEDLKKSNQFKTENVVEKKDAQNDV